MNSAALQILAYPEKVETIEDLHEYLVQKLRSNSLLQQSSYAPNIAARFQSGKRMYLCRIFRVNTVIQSNSQPSVVIILERCSERRISLCHVSETFHLTTREQEVLQQLVAEGLTTKEIAARMGISPNTVKAFLRLIMVKMGVRYTFRNRGKGLIWSTIVIFRVPDSCGYFRDNRCAKENSGTNHARWKEANRGDRSRVRCYELGLVLGQSTESQGEISHCWSEVHAKGTECRGRDRISWRTLKSWCSALYRRLLPVGTCRSGSP